MLHGANILDGNVILCKLQIPTPFMLVKEITELVSNMDFTVIMLTDEGRGGRGGTAYRSILLFSRPDSKARCKFIISCLLWGEIIIILDSTGRQMSEAFQGKTNGTN